MSNRKVRTPGQPDEAEGDAAQAAEATVDAPQPAAAGGKALPHPDTIDARKITMPVLSSQGWVCPDPEAGVVKMRL